MNKIISKTKELAITLGFTAIANNCKRTSTKEEVFGYILLMANYMMAKGNEAQKEKITACLRLLVVQLNFVSNSNFTLAA